MKGLADLERALNPEQQAAVLHDGGPLLLLAGAGTGKTRVITWRIAHLVGVRGARPDEVLAVTFTNKAAREMRDRAVALGGDALTRATLSTFHSAGARWLRRHGRAVGLGRGFTIYDEDDQVALLKQVAEEIGLPHDTASAKSYRHRIEGFKQKAWRVHEAEEAARGADGERMASLFKAYEAALLRANAADFGDLIARVVHLLEDDPDLRDGFRARYPHVLVDEFQDTNEAQYKLLGLLAARDGDVTVVGDDDQSIYRWRGATVENVRRFADDFACRVIPLEQNYRSTSTILAAAHDVVAPLTDRMDKQLRTEREDTEPIRAFVGRDDGEEADWIARSIDRLRTERGLRYSDFAVFYRQNAQSRILEERLRMLGVPHEIVGGVGFYGRREVKDVLAYLRLAANPNDDVAFRRIVNVPSRGIGQGTLKQIEAHRIDAGHASLFDALEDLSERPGRRIPKRTRGGVSDFVSLISTLRRGLDDATADELLHTVLVETDYEAWIAKQEPNTADERVRNVDELRNASRDFVQRQPDGSLTAFLEAITLREPEGDEPVVDDDSRVTLMTVHGSKGLEFPVVFVTGLEDGQFPMKRRGEMPSPEESDEERRLCYVAFTRAQHLLAVSAAMRRRQYGQWRDNTPSEFFTELRDEHVVIDPASASDTLDFKRGGRTYGGSGRSVRAPARDLFDQRPWYERAGRDDVVMDVPEDGVVFDERFYPQDSVSSAKEWVGRQAKHKLFGVGTITAADPSGDRVRLTIQFADVGTKKVIASFVELL